MYFWIFLVSRWSCFWVNLRVVARRVGTATSRGPAQLDTGSQEDLRFTFWCTWDASFDSWWLPMISLAYISVYIYICIRIRIYIYIYALYNLPWFAMIDLFNDFFFDAFSMIFIFHYLKCNRWYTFDGKRWGVSQVRRTQPQGFGSLRAAPSASWPSEFGKLLGIQTLLGDAVEVINQCNCIAIVMIPIIWDVISSYNYGYAMYNLNCGPPVQPW